MKKKDLAERLARETNLSPGAAADELDYALHSVLKTLRHQDRQRPTALQKLIQEATRSTERKGRPAP
jgi:nucleoid DNA-binding protein